MSHKVNDFTEDLEIIQKLDDEPNDVDGLSAEQLKEKFDLAGLLIQKFLNEALIPSHNGLDTDVNQRIDEVIEELKKISEINADNLGAQNIALDKVGETTLAEQYGLTSLVPTVYEALAKLGSLAEKSAELLSVSSLSSHMADLNALIPTAKYTEHWWLRRLAHKSDGYSKGAVQTTSGPGVYTGRYLCHANSYNATVGITYASSVKVDDRGIIQLVEPQTVLFDYYSFVKNGAVLSGSYVKSDAFKEVYYFPTSAKLGCETINGECYYYMSHLQLVEVNTVDRAWQCVSSENENEYPRAGVAGDYEYRYIGSPVENSTRMAKMDFGFYRGTEAFGESAPNSLKFQIQPELVIIKQEGAKPEDMLFAIRGESTVAGVHLTWGENSLTWHSSTAAGQLNVYDNVYRYVALGV